MLKFTILAVLFLQASSLSTVKELDLQKYLGDWYEVYGNKFDKLFMGDGKCVKAHYGLQENGTISVYNSQLSKDGKVQDISGYAYQESSDEPGKLRVHLNGGAPYDAPYYVYALGPEYFGEYDYSVVSDKFHTSLFVLCRNVTRFYQFYNKDVLKFLNDNNFHNLVQIDQNNC